MKPQITNGIMLVDNHSRRATWDDDDHLYVSLWYEVTLAFTEPGTRLLQRIYLPCRPRFVDLIWINQLALDITGGCRKGPAIQLAATGDKIASSICRNSDVYPRWPRKFQSPRVRGHNKHCDTNGHRWSPNQRFRDVDRSQVVVSS